MAKFTYTTRKDGRLMKRVSINGKIETLYATNPKNLEKKYIEKKHLSNKGIYLNSIDYTVSEWADKWLKLYKNDKEKSTIEMYKSCIKLYIKPSIGNINIKHLKQSDIMQMLSDMEKKKITRRKEIALLTIKQILDSAVQNDLVYRNVAINIKLKKHRAKEKIPLDDNYISIIEKSLKSNPHSFLVYFLIYTGLRREEVVPLQYKDIDFNKKIIHINKAVYFEKNQPTLKTTKNSEFRDVPLLDNLYNLLINNTYNEKDYIFPNQKGKMMSETTFKRKISYVDNFVKKEIDKTNKDKKENEKIKLIHFTAHQLRHTYACILHKAKIPLKEAQYFMGHKDIKMLLNIYTHLDDEDKTNAINLLNNSIKI